MTNKYDKKLGYEHFKVITMRKDITNDSKKYKVSILTDITVKNKEYYVIKLQDENDIVTKINILSNDKDTAVIISNLTWDKEFPNQHKRIVYKMNYEDVSYRIRDLDIE